MGEPWREYSQFYAMNSYNFEINVGHKCNMRCKFCFEQGTGYTNVATSASDFAYFADYMEYVKKKTGGLITATVYGGEPFLHLDTLVPFVLRIADMVTGVSLVTNGLEVKRYEKEIDQMAAALKGPWGLRMSVSYNFSLQDETRQEGTYERIRDSIRFLCAKGFEVTSPVVFTPDNIHRIGEVFDDFVALRKETGGKNRVRFNYFVPNGVPFSVVKEDVLRSECARIRDIIEAPDSNVSYKDFLYSMIGRRRGDRQRDCIFSFVRAALGPDGRIYPGYDVVHTSEATKRLLTLGHIGDPFESIEKRRRDLLKLLPVDAPIQCKTCPSQCRVIPWRTMEQDDVSQFNQMPNPDRCKVVQIIGEYLPISGVIHGQ